MYRHRALALDEDGDERQEMGTVDILSHSLQKATSQLIETGSDCWIETGKSFSA
jgi:hypothetical protein